MIKIVEITALAHIENQKGKFLYQKKKKKEEVMDGNYMKRVTKITMSILIVLVVMQSDDYPHVQVQTSADEHFKYCEGRNLLFSKQSFKWMCHVSCLSSCFQ